VLYNCWHCGASGREDLRVQMNPTRGCIQPRVVPPRVGFKVLEDDFTGMANELSKEATEYLRKRGISKSTAERAGLTSSKRYVQVLGRSTETIDFPYILQGVRTATKHRSIEGKGFSCSGSPQSFFMSNLLQDAPEELIFCEGEMDSLSFLETGLVALSIPNGAVNGKNSAKGDQDNNGDHRFKYLHSLQDKIEKAKKVILALDSDGPGQFTSEELARRIGKYKCYRVEWPDGCKDANDLLLKGGVEAVKQAITEASPFPVQGLYDVRTFQEGLLDLYSKGIARGESTGYSCLDNLYSIVPGQMTIVTGIPSSGKSELVDQLMINLALSCNWKFAVCSFENEPRIHIAKLISKVARQPFFDGPTPRLSQDEVIKHGRWLNNHFSFLYQADGSLSSIDSIIERLKVAVLRHGIRGAVIDPYNYIERPRSMSETEWISEMLTRLSVFVKAHDIHLWFVAHPTKMYRNQEGKVPIPKGYDISGSGAWYAKADFGMTVHRPEPDKSTLSEVHIWKCRFEWMGKQGTCELSYDRASHAYTEDVIRDGPRYSSDDF
jgi:twinkle protein